MRRLNFYSLVGLFLLILVIVITSYAIIANWRQHPGIILILLVVVLALAVGIGTLVRTILEIIKINRNLPKEEPTLIKSTSQSISTSLTQTGIQDTIAKTLRTEKIAGTTIENQTIQNLLDSIPSPLFSIPNPPADFIGREVELNEFLRAVESRGLIIAGESGSGGVGKTALAYQFAQSIASYYPDGQIYLDLRGAREQRPLLPSEAMSSVVHAYQPDIKLPENEMELQALYRSVLQNQHALLLLDNAGDFQQVEPLMPPDSCLLLVTSSGQFRLPGMKTYQLEALPEEYAEKLLRKIVPRAGEYARRLAGLCGRLPLALRVAARSLRESPSLSLPDYLARLDELMQRLELTGVEASLQLSYELLEENLQGYFRLLAVFPGSFDKAAAASVWELEGSSAADILGELLRFNLIEYNSLTRRFKLHDLARLFAGRMMEAEEREAAKKLHAGHYLKILDTADQFYRGGGEAYKAGLALFDLEWGNIQAGHAWSVEKAAQDESASHWCVDYPTAGSNIINIRLQPAQMIAWLEAAVESARRAGDRRSEGNWLSSLGNACREMGQVEQASVYLKQALEIFEEIKSPDAHKVREWLSEIDSN